MVNKMAQADDKAEIQELRRKLSEALARCAEMETNLGLKPKLEHASKSLGHDKEKKLDHGKAAG